MATPKENAERSDPSKYKLEADGSFIRPATVFRNFVEKGGRFEPQAGKKHFQVVILHHPDSSNSDRYHLYVSPACREYMYI